MLMLETIKHVNITYNLGNITSWLSAAGTIAAVIVSLYLARHKGTPFLTFQADYSPKDTREEYSSMSTETLKVLIKNYSNRPVSLVPVINKEYTNIDDALFVNEYTSKAEFRNINIRKFSEFNEKLFVLHDTLSGNDYAFKLEKRTINDKVKWEVVYPLKFGRARCWIEKITYKCHC